MDGERIFLGVNRQDIDEFLTTQGAEQCVGCRYAALYAAHVILRLDGVQHEPLPMETDVSLINTGRYLLDQDISKFRKATLDCDGFNGVCNSENVLVMKAARKIVRKVYNWLH